MPSTQNTELNAQTIEGGLFIWDGANTRLDYGLGFQWHLNPWDQFGDLRCWTNVEGEWWKSVGTLQPDMEWHEVRLVFDYRRQATAFTIDNKHYLTYFTGTPKGDSWGTEIAAGVQAEIISIWPGEEGNGALHKAEFKNWSWLWEPYSGCSLFLPAVVQ